MSSSGISIGSKLAISIVFIMTVCLVFAGCGSTTKVDAHTTTIGQELKDLDEARNQGLLTEDEYSKKRQEILKRK